MAKSTAAAALSRRVLSSDYCLPTSDLWGEGQAEVGEFAQDHEHEQEGKTGVYGARTRNLRRDRAAL